MNIVNKKFWYLASFWTSQVLLIVAAVLLGAMTIEIGRILYYILWVLFCTLTVFWDEIYKMLFGYLNVSE